MSDNSIKWKPSLYASYFAILKDLAWCNGYALALHGSMNRDLDLIAVPWVEDCVSPTDLVKGFSEVLTNTINPDGEPFYEMCDAKPHNRLSFVIPINQHCYIDLAVYKPVEMKDE